MKDPRHVIPTAMHNSVLDLMNMNMKDIKGIAKCRTRAREAVWQQCISRKIDKLVRNWKTSVKEHVNPAEPLMPNELPDRPWQKVTTVWINLNDTHNLLIDYYSRYVEVAKLTLT